MNNPKNMLLIALIFLGFLLFMQWQQDYAPKPAVKKASDSSIVKNKTEQSNKTSILQQTQKTSDDVPTVSTQATTNLVNITEQPQKKTRTTGSIIEVTTNVLKLKIDTIGGSIVYSELLKYPKTKNSKENIVLLNQQADKAYYAQSGLISTQQSFVHTDTYKAEKNHYEINTGTVDIPLSIEKNGIKETKTYSISADDYLIGLTDTIENNSNIAWQGQQYRQLQRTNPWKNKKVSYSDSGRMSFRGASYYDAEDGYTKLKFKDFQEDKIDVEVNDENWIAMSQHYFFSSIIDDDKKTHIQSQYLPNSQTPYIIRSTSDGITVAPASNGKMTAKIYIGPKLQNNLPDIAKGLNLTVDYGMFTAIAKPLFWVLNKIHALVGNWGWSIILLTFLVKMLFFKLTEKQYNSMAKMRKLQPRIKTLKERHKDNKQKFNEEMMKFYKKEKVNPMGGCLPMMVQIPVFISLYWVLMESVELRQAPFMLWLQDLSSPDPLYILPASYAIIMFFTQKLSPTPGMDAMQAKIMKFMPIGFSVLFAFFQSGLVLYMVVNAGISLIQQWVITKRIEAKG
jgi:YidC/Oxa1 family membrane protein insertase